MKTSKEIMHDCQDCTVDLEEKWILVDDVIKWIDREIMDDEEIRMNKLSPDWNHSLIALKSYIKSKSNSR